MFHRVLRPEMTTSEFVSCIIVLYIQPVLCLVGVLFNAACIGVFLMVWNNREYYRKTSLILYLAALSICNILQLMLSFPVIIMPAVEQFIDDREYPLEYNAISEINSRTVRVAYPLLMAANYSSIWILTLICAQRFHSICHPSDIWKSRLNFVKHSRLCVLICALLAISLNAVRWWELEARSIGGESDEVAESSLRLSTLYKIVQEGLLYGFIVYLIPTLMLIWLNYHTLQIVSMEKQQLRPCRPIAEHRTAMMTVCVFFFFFVCTTMAVCLRLVIILFGNMFIYTEFAWMVDCSNLLMNTNALVMPMVCFVFTRGFRDLFFAIRHPPPLPTPTLLKSSVQHSSCMPIQCNGNHDGNHAAQPLLLHSTILTNWDLEGKTHAKCNHV